MLAAILPPLLPPRRSMLLTSQASTTRVAVDARLWVPQETTEAPMPEDRSVGTEDSAGATVVPRAGLRGLEFELQHGLAPLAIDAVTTCCHCCLWHGEPFRSVDIEDQGERILLGSVRIFQAIRQ
jgi:hypothetical protein